MTINTLFDLLARLLFIVLSISTLISYIKYRDPLRRDVALLFGSLSLPFFISSVTQLTGITLPILSLIGACILMAQPYLLIRLVGYFRVVSQWIQRIGIVGTLVSWIIILLYALAPSSAFAVISLGIVAYFVGMNGYAALRFIKHAQPLVGVALYRMRLVAIGTGMLALLLFIAGLQILLPQTQFASSVTSMFALVAAASYYLAVTPPRWLLNIWQTIELRRFLSDALEITDSQTLLDELCHVTIRAVGAQSAYMVIQDETNSRFRWLNPFGDTLSPIDAAYLETGAFSEVWQTQQARYIHRHLTGQQIAEQVLKPFSAGAAFIIPLIRQRQIEGLLLVFLQYGSLFVDDDLNLLTLLSNQTTTQLHNIRLMEQTRARAAQLADTVKTRTNELQESEDRYQRLVEMSPEAIVVQVNGILVFANPAAIELLAGSKPEALLGRSIYDFVHPDYHAIAQARVDKLNNRQRVPLIEEKLIRLDGKIIDVEVIGIPTIYNGQSAAQVVIREITERKQMEMTLRQSEAKFRALLTAAPTAIVIINQHGEIGMINQRTLELFGYSENELIGQSIEMLLPDHLRDIHTNHRVGFFDMPRTRMMGHGLDLLGQKKDGAAFPIEVGLSYVETADGLLAMGFITDITERKQAEREILELNTELEERIAQRTAHLAAVNKELEAFSYSVSHDLRSPLRAIDGFSLALLEDYSDVIDGMGRNYLSRVRAATQRMGQLIDDLLQLSKITRADLEFEQVNLSEIINEIIAELRETEPTRQVETAIHPHVTVTADEHLLRVMMQNLISNAWKFTQKQAVSKIEFHVTDDEDSTVYFLRDNGAGFDMAYADRLFGAFQRLHSHNEFEGTGIGLATVKRIIHRHGGDIWAESAVDNGATFYFTLAQINIESEPHG